MTADEQVEAVAQVLGEALAPSLYEALMEATHDSWRQWRFLTPQAREKHRAHAAEMVAESLAPTLLASPAFRAIVAAERAAAWDEGVRTGTSRAMRKMSDEPDLPLASSADNPYRAETQAP